jgi:hypothetical protein
MFPLKPLSRESIPTALARVERYRLLNEPWEAESICRDVLEIEPDNQQALVSLLLAITDQFRLEMTGDLTRAREVLPRLQSEYQRAYYAGIICERQAKVILRRSAPGSGPAVYDWLRQAMEWYEQAEALRPAGDDSALLRWNTCARLIMRNDHVRPAPPEQAAMELE